ncbi:MAG: tRNA (adenosine(37)-N6)-dimethylallyltransferase MiaA [Rhodospirillales bacterium]|nr:tRNA (adenosine(37)-N6)-dimethylallyltransferase MiaA [Alphaproteobacteria bacterium]MCB9986949.1 tRNA (adenosine(37)-N6)-dimethylallyltransferase MiaA [Rhodospirillales bacterium]USO08276.1 MAG: tRNA (adenosine(37)-N6)-dimethylallyltransferase MiaA [Rhodospirillales bacterium]
MQVTILIGPTASGKSALAVARGRTENATIINADAMQCYDTLPILTAQPRGDERGDEQGGLPHRLYGFLDATQTTTAADWTARAATEIRAAFATGRAPWLVGGTGLYLKALMQGLSPMPDIPDDIRARVRATPRAALYAELQARDPVMSARLEPGDTQRIMRAMEVLETTGESLSAWQNQPPRKPDGDWAYRVIALNPPKDILERNIRARLDAMVDAGVMEEVRALAQKIDDGAVPENAPVTVAHGFKYLRKALKGDMTLEDAIERTAIETRQYTKRQRTWLRHQITPDEVIGENQ